MSLLPIVREVPDLRALFLWWLMTITDDMRGSSRRLAPHRSGNEISQLFKLRGFDWKAKTIR